MIHLAMDTPLLGDPLSGWDLVPWRKLARSAAELRVFPAQLFFLASAFFDHVNGEVLVVDGGYMGR